jgi:hypothetical protein
MFLEVCQFLPSKTQIAKLFLQDTLAGMQDVARKYTERLSTTSSISLNAMNFTSVS